jgi:hypothetical protein
MIYVPEQEIEDVFADRPDNTDLRLLVQNQLIRMTKLWGGMTWEPEAKEEIRKWHMAGGPPTPMHSKLQGYRARRTQHLVKLSLCMAVNRGQYKQICLQDLLRAQQMLFRAEEQMPDIFRAMQGKSDIAIIEELHYHLTSLWQMQKQKPVDESYLYSFLSKYLPVERVPRLLEAAERGKFIARLAGTNTYVPRPKHQHGME